MAAVVWLGLGREVNGVLGCGSGETGGEQERPGGENHADLGRGVSGQPVEVWSGWREMPICSAKQWGVGRTVRVGPWLDH